MANGFEVLVTLDGKTFRGQAQNKKAAKAAAAKEALINNPHLLRSRLEIFLSKYGLKRSVNGNLESTVEVLQKLLPLTMEEVLLPNLMNLLMP